MGTYATTAVSSRLRVEDVPSLPDDALRTLSVERRALADPTERARAARKELQRREWERQAAEVRGILLDSLLQVNSWSAALHPRTWEAWREVAVLALRARARGAGISVTLHNGCAVGVAVMPRGAHWTFWPPGVDGDDPVPPDCVAVAWELADAARVER